MSDSKRIHMKTYPIEDNKLLKGKQTEFQSMAELITTRAAEITDKPYVLFYEQTITYKQMNERANQVAHYLREMGVQKGDVVSFMILNSPDIYYVMFGTQKLGAISGGINFLLKGPEIAHILNDSKPKVVFVGSEYMKDFYEGYKLADHKPLVVEVKTGAEHGVQIAQQDLATILASYPTDNILVEQSPEDPYLLLYSSGTTGRAKGILLPNRAELAMCKDWASVGIFEEGDVFLIILPMFHSNALCVWTYPMAYLGLSICIRKTFSPMDFFPAVLDNGVTHVLAVPAMYAYVNSMIKPESVDKSKLKLKYTLTGAAPFPLELKEELREKYGMQILEGYGLTEASGFSTGNLNVPNNLKSIGVALGSQQVEIMDDNNKVLAAGKTGEICVKGDAVMLGYLNNPEATSEALKDGWLHTGDMGYMDEQGYVYMAGRKKEMINRGGENIYPREIEMALEEHPAVVEAVVIGVPDKALGERVKAYIIVQDNISVSEEDLKIYLGDKIAKYKLPEKIEIRKDLPRNTTGKVLKYVLVEENLK